MTDDMYNVLFICTSNSARSLFAEAILNKTGAGRFKAYSAGSQPADRVHPYALDLLRMKNHPADALYPKSWDAFSKPDAPVMDFVFTVCARAGDETCPDWPDKPVTAHWGIPDPVFAVGTEAEKRLAFADAYRFLSNRIGFFTALPIDQLGRLTLQNRLDEIGKTTIDQALLI